MSATKPIRWTETLFALHTNYFWKGCRIAERTQIRAPGLNGQPGEPGKTPKTPQVQQKSVEANPKKKKKIAAQ